MNILYDYQIWESQKYGGISRYFVELMKNSGEKYNCILGGKYSDNVYIRDLGLLKSFPNYKPDFIGNKINGLLCRINKEDTINKIKDKNIDLIHPTYYDPYCIGKKKMVCTVHDMIHEIYFDFLKDEKTIENKKRMIYAADAIIAISENTKKDILRIYPDIDSEKINVIYHGNCFPIVKEMIKEDYILYTGTRYSYKNFGNFINAIAPILKENNIKLICTGGQFTNDEIELFRSLGIENNVNHVFATDEELIMLYAKAKLFVFPSLYEGFGIPILEAFSTGCPLLLSNTSCFPEIAGEAGCYFDPFSVNDIREKILDVLLSEDKQKELAERGYERVKNFSWDKTSNETANVYRKVLSE